MGIGYRIKEARERLGLTQTELGAMIGVTGSAITNYEKETSHPKEQIIYKLMETLNIDANYLFQDAVKLKSSNNVSLLEYELIKKYRDLDEHGKEMVDFTLLKEWERSIQNNSLSDNIVTYAPNVQAAHNDYEDDPEEQEKMKSDLDMLKRPK